MLLALSLLLVARAGPDTATNAAIVEPRCKVAVRMDPRACPPGLEIEIRHELPNPSYSVKKTSATVDAKARRIRVHLELQSKPGLWPQVTVPTKTTIDVGVLAKGYYVVEVISGDVPMHAFVLEAR